MNLIFSEAIGRKWKERGGNGKREGEMEIGWFEETENIWVFEEEF